MAVIAPPHGCGSRLCSVRRGVCLGRYPLALVNRFRAAYGMGCSWSSRFPARHGHYHVFPPSYLRKNLTLVYSKGVKSRASPVLCLRRDRKHAVLPCAMMHVLRSTHVFFAAWLRRMYGKTSTKRNTFYKSGTA